MASGGLLRYAVGMVFNDQVHAAGAFDVDFKTDIAARSRATPGYRLYAVSAFAIS